MRRLLTGVFTLLLILGIFGTGYYLGISSTVEDKKRYADLKNDMMVKTRNLEDEILLMRVRMNLDDARHLLGLAQSDIGNKNFGEAETKLGWVRNNIDRAIPLSTESTRMKLRPLLDESESIKIAIRRFSPRANDQITALDKAIEEITEKERNR